MPNFQGVSRLYVFSASKVKFVGNVSEHPTSAVIEVLLNSLLMMMVSRSSFFLSLGF